MGRIEMDLSNALYRIVCVVEIAARLAHRDLRAQVSAARKRVSIQTTREIKALRALFEARK